MRRLACARMKIAMVTGTYPPEVNGVARTVQEMVEGLRRRGHAIRLARPRQGDNDQPFLDGNLHEWLGSGIAIPRYPQLKMGLPAKGALVRQWREWRPDIARYTNDPDAEALGEFCRMICRSSGLRVVNEAKL